MITGERFSVRGQNPGLEPIDLDVGLPTVSPTATAASAPVKHELALPQGDKRASLAKQSLLKALPADPVVRRFMDQYKDHSRTAYHHEDDIWEDVPDVGKELAAIASRRESRIASRSFERYSSSSGRLPKDHLSLDIDARDAKSPDSWIKRNPELLRLTGRHPMNAEPSPTNLFDQGFITPVSLHYVRNHGKTPQIEWDDHTLTIDGLVEKPTTWTMDELVKMPSTTIPVTTQCSGQRRKEMNMISKTAGFNWSCTGHSCNLWTGVKLADLLNHCGVDMERARFVWLEGSEHEGLPNGTYGTSIDLVTGLSPYEHVLLAYQQNGINLHPDHGFPLRCIVPGYCGGRSVKWISNIKVMDRPSDNFYHYHDNRILPPFVNAQIASENGWYFRDEYVYNQLNINSVTVYPAHLEKMYQQEHGSYAIRGFANSGGGRKITRVELTFDGANTWNLCSVEYPEERYSDAPKYGKYFAWTFWEYTIDKGLLWKLAEKGCAIRVRAWDVANNTQPFYPTWNVLGQGNNCQYVVKMEMREEEGNKFVQFVHPVGELHETTGWMIKPEEPLQEEVDKVLTKQQSIIALGGMPKFISKAEIAKHNSAESCWLTIDGGVYDVTGYLKHHPGGAESIIMNGGDDATEDFLAIHSKKARALLDEFYIGDAVEGDEEEDTEKAAPGVDPEGNLIALHPKKWQEFELIDNQKVSHDTRLFKFKLQSPEHLLGLPTGHHMYLQAPVDGKTIVRAYTPISPKDTKGEVTLCIKVYFAGEHPKFPEGGKMTQHLENMKIGDMIKAKGPLGHFEYKTGGNVIMHGHEKHVKKFGMIVGGTGLTPAYQVLQAIYNDPGDTTEVHLLYANRTEEDILMREQLEKMAGERDNIKVWYTVVKTADPKLWKYSTGYMNEAMIKKHTPEASDDTVIGLCGPPLMVTDCCIPALTKLGHDEKNVVVF